MRAALNQPAEGATRATRVGRGAAFAAGEAVVVLACAAATLQPWRYDLRVPFYYGSDALWFTTVAKGLMLNGWPFAIPQLSAPFALNAVAFPATTTVDWALMKLLAVFVGDAGVVLNVFWLLSLVLTAWSASAALALLDVAPWLAFTGGVLYALLPCAFIRNVIHINLVYYAVPLLCLLAVHVARASHADRSDRRIRRVGYAAAVVQGLNYVYFTFFGLLLLAVAALIGAVRGRRTGGWRVALVASAILTVAAGANLAPSLRSWWRDGRPPGLDYKTLAEADAYALTIRQMLAPQRDDPLSAIGAWRRVGSGAGFPAERETVAARLGPFAAVGLIFMLAAAVGLLTSRDRERADTLHAAATLGLTAVLIATVGGFGSVVNVLTIPDIRAYNRMSVFIAFFAIASLSVWLTALLDSPLAGWRRRGLAIATCGLIGVSLFDQLLDAAALAHRQPDNLAAAARDEMIVNRLEQDLPEGAAVFQLPITEFPADPGLTQMRPYDHARPALWSHGLRWSWPSFSQRHHAWLDHIQALQGAELLRALVVSDFSAIWIDRFGFADRGRAIVDDLHRAGAPLLLEDEQERYAVLDLRPFRRSLEATLGPDDMRAERRRILEFPGIVWGQGFSVRQDGWGGRPFRWSAAHSELAVSNYSSRQQQIRFSFELYAAQPGNVAVRVDDGQQQLSASRTPIPATLEVVVAAGGSRRIEFVAATQPTVFPGDERELFFAMIDPRLSTVDADAD
jgi:phosphoglycerol transferase